MNKIFEFITIDKKELMHVVELEPKLSDKIDFSKPFTVRIMHDHYLCLLHSIISENETNVNIDSIWHKLFFMFNNVNPKVIASASKEQLSANGIANDKISLIKAITYDIVDKKLKLDKLVKEDTEAIKKILLKYKGLSEWVIDILLLCSYMKSDILPFDDPDVKKGLSILYAEQEITKDFISECKNKFGSNSSMFTFCLWKINS